MKYLTVLILGLILLGSAISSGREQNSLILSKMTRDLTRNYVEQNSKEKDTDASEIFITMDYSVRHEALPPNLLERTVNRANSHKFGGWFDKETMKTYGAAFATDFYYHELEHVEREAKQDKALLDLQRQVDELKKQLEELKQSKNHAGSS